LTALAHVGGEAINDWRAQNPDREIRLNRAKLSHTDLRASNLAGADLSHADLSHADLREADLTDANLRGANLHHANLETARGLTPVQLAGCNLAGARLPASVNPEALAAGAALGEAGNYTRHLFMWLAGMCGFCVLTLAAMPCCQLLTADGTVKLPVFNASIRTSLFFTAAPILIIGAFHYFHICLQRLWERLADLPAVFPDGQPLDRKTSGWIMLSLAHRTPRAVRRQRPRAMFRTQTILNVILAYVMAPATILIIWWRYALRHDWNGSILHALAFAWTIHLAIGCYAAATGALRGKKRRVLLWGRHAVAVGALFFMQSLMQDSFGGSGLMLFNVRLKGEDVSHRPTGWTATRMDVIRRYTLTLPGRINPLVKTADPRPAVDFGDYAAEYEQAYAAVRGAQLTRVNLAGASIIDSHLASAEMLGADLNGAEVLESDLSRAELGFANLEQAKIYSSWMVGASFQQANLHQAALYEVVAFDARFNGANLCGVTTNLVADFRRADFTKANLSTAQLSRGTFSEARFDDARMDNAVFDQAELGGASLAGADLRGASFKKARLHDADFTGAQFGDGANALKITKTPQPGTDLRGANLTGAKGLTREQLALALVDEATKLPEYLVESRADAEPAPTAATLEAPVPHDAAVMEEVAASDAAPQPPAAPAEREDVAEAINPLRARR
jgi:uncharacterized protein YjbI with pentapeptide repeats